MRKYGPKILWLAVLGLCFWPGGKVFAQWPANEIMLRNGKIVKANPLMEVDLNYVDLGDGRTVYRAEVSLICLYDCQGAPQESFRKDLLVLKDGARKFGKIKIIKGWSDNYVVLSGKKISFTAIRYIKFADPMPDE